MAYGSSNGLTKSASGLQRSDMGPILASASQSDRELMKAELRPVLKDWCEWVKLGVKQGARNALQMYARAMELWQTDINLILVLARELGVGSMEEARGKILAASEAEPLSHDPEAMARRMLEFLEDHYRPQGKRVVILDEAE